MKQVVLAIFTLFVLLGFEAACIEITEWTIDDFYFASEESINGDGSFATYYNAQTRGPHTDNRLENQYSYVKVKELKHGSGTINNEKMTTAEEVNLTIGMDGYNITKLYGSVWMTEDNTMTYSPETISIGTGYYASNPINYRSPLTEKTYIKNYATEASMQHETLYAKAIDKDLEVLVKDKYYDDTDSHRYDIGWTVMDVAMDVTDGTTYLGVLQGNTADSDTSAWKDPLIDIEEAYYGTYRIDSNMTLYWPVERLVSTSSWLSCCFGGYLDMDAKDKKWIEPGVFDCTCFDVSVEAEF